MHPKRALIAMKPALFQPALKMSKRSKKCCCSGCGLRLRSSKKSLRYRREKIPGLCHACTMMFKVARRDDLFQGFTQSNTRPDHKRYHEANFLQYLHKMQGSNDSISSKEDLYHLPLSTNYYRKLSQRRFAYHSSSPGDNTVSHFKACANCLSFVCTRRRTLLCKTRQARRKRSNGDNLDKNISKQVASVLDLFEIMVASNLSCAFSGSKGIWHSHTAYRLVPLYALSLDHKVPLSQGGSSTVDNLQVSLTCLNNIKSDHRNKSFIKWWKAFSRKQGRL